MANRFPLAEGEWYHIYNRGVDRRNVFLDKKDYERFLLLMYLCNTENRSVHLSDIKKYNFIDIFLDSSMYPKVPIVVIGAYCLMPNHIHIAIKPLKDKSISLFMQKIMTGYTMYFNKKYVRNGALFASTFKSKHVPNDIYFKKLISYIHLNPVEIFDRKWKGGASNLEAVEKEITNYRYSSLPDFLNTERLECKIISNNVFDLFDNELNLRKMIKNANEYYHEYFQEVKPPNVFGGIP